jgi:hypothetical protein
MNNLGFAVVSLCIFRQNSSAFNGSIVGDLRSRVNRGGQIIATRLFDCDHQGGGRNKIVIARRRENLDSSFSLKGDREG